MTSSLLSPSESVKSEDNIKKAINGNHGIHSHRPAYNHGPPTALFHPDLAKLRFRLENLDSLEELEPNSTSLASCHNFIVNSCKFFEGEKVREEVLKDIICKFIVGKCSWQTFTDDKKAKPDVTWGDTLTYAIGELKNEYGLGGSTILQGSVVYAKILAQKEVSRTTDSSNYVDLKPL